MKARAGTQHGAARDGWHESAPTKAAIAAVDPARATDPAFVVRRNAARALSAHRA
jgi:hypothetical protein